MKTKTWIAAALLSACIALPASAMTYKSTYAKGCGELWNAVKDTLSNPSNYTVETRDDAQMTAAYHVKHTVHVDITGTVLQRINHVTLVQKGSGGCEMGVVSNYSGWGHNDQGDFKKRVDQSLLKSEDAKPAGKPEASKQ